jgi:hypothetical protein
VKVNPNAPICFQFASLGYCDTGAQCPNRHEYECPTYTAKGRCDDPKCRLPHIDRAAQFRQMPNNMAPTAATNVNNIGNPNPILDNLDVALSSSEQSNASTSGNDHASVNQIGNAQPDSAKLSSFSQEHNFLSVEDIADDEFESRFASDDQI